VSFKLWLPLPAKFLLLKDNIQKADCIVPLEGDLYYRLTKAVELFHNGYSKNIVISLLPEAETDTRDYCAAKMRIYGIKDIPRKDFALKALKYFGKDEKGVFFTDSEVTSTYEEALATKAFMLKNELKSMILVTSQYHSRRALMLFSTVLKSSGIKIYYCTAGRENLMPEEWWSREGEIKSILQEYLSLIHNAIYHLMLHKKRTSFDTY
jgi:uncharacterized SAM-binding protein YcdF (DUF218 family)